MRTPLWIQIELMPLRSTSTGYADTLMPIEISGSHKKRDPGGVQRWLEVFFPGNNRGGVHPTHRQLNTAPSSLRLHHRFFSLYCFLDGTEACESLPELRF